MGNSRKKPPTFLRKHWLRWTYVTRRSNLLLQDITEGWNASIKKTMKNSMPDTPYIPLMTLPGCLLSGRNNTAISPCAHSTGALPKTSFILFQMCNTSLINLQILPAFPTVHHWQNTSMRCIITLDMYQAIYIKRFEKYVVSQDSSSGQSRARRIRRFSGRWQKQERRKYEQTNQTIFRASFGSDSLLHDPWGRAPDLFAVHRHL